MMVTMLLAAAWAKPKEAETPPPPPPPPAPALFEMVTAEQVAQALTEAGYRGEIAAAENGNLLVKTAMSGRGVHVTGYDCDQETPQRCKSVHILWGEVDEWNTSLETVNAWNNEKRYTQAVQSSGDVLQLAMDMQFFGGATLANLAANLRTFDGLLGEYLVFLKSKSTAP